MGGRRIRVLWCGEFSGMDTGFATYSREVLTRLGAGSASCEFEVCEFANYLDPADSRLQSTPWPCITAIPDEAEARKAYDADPRAQFGSHRFDGACVAWKPDVVASHLDWWMMSHVDESPFRPRFGFACMPTVDAEPQAAEWLDTYRRADALLTYTTWAAGVLERAGCSPLGAASPAADYAVFRPLDRGACRDALGVPRGAFVAGMVARNQSRKLFPELINAFSAFARGPAGGDSFLYLHTAYPDVGWDLPNLVRDSLVSARILFTYKCASAPCGAVFASPWQDAGTWCPACGAFGAKTPTSQNGISRRELAAIMNCLDVNVQCVSSEGFGLPVVEAAACGVPLIGIDYAAVGDVALCIGGKLIPLAGLRREPETGCDRAVPDLPALTRLLAEAATLPLPVLRRWGENSRRAAVAEFSYEKAAALWALALRKAAGPRSWAPGCAPFDPEGPDPGGEGPEFVSRGMALLAGRPEWARSLLAARILRDLGWGATMTHGGPYVSDHSWLAGQKKMAPFGRAEALELFRSLGRRKAHFEALLAREAPRG